MDLEIIFDHTASPDCIRVLLPALVLTFILNRLGSYLFSYPSYHLAVEATGFVNFIGNLVFLQLVPPYGSNGPLWSLSYEFWYYMLFPLLFISLLHSRKAIKIMYISLSVLIFLLVGHKISLYFIIWLMGTLVLILPIVTVFKNMFLFILSLLFMCGALYIRPLVLSGRLFTGGGTKEVELFIVDLSLGIFSSACIYLMLHMILNRSERIKPNRRLYRFRLWLGSYNRV
jgi:peptidoglycan/LPS O-acetylase OafA/YrhL